MSQVEKGYKGKRVLVTGGAGFIGSHLVEKLVSLGAHVSILDNFSSGNLQNIRSVFTHVNLFYADITSSYSCMKATANKDYVFHTAAFVSVPGSVENPDACHKINAQGTRNVLEGCKENGVKSLVFSSSSAVYGNRDDICKESDAPNPLSPYAQSKLDGEVLCKEYAQENSMHTACLRYFNVYGDRQDPHGHYAAVVAKFKQNLQEHKPLIIYGDGMQTRDFINVSDVVQANLKIALRDNKPGEIFNVGSGKSINLLDLIELLEKELNITREEIKYMPARSGDITHSLGACDKYKQAIK